MKKTASIILITIALLQSTFAIDFQPIYENQLLEFQDNSATFYFSSGKRLWIDSTKINTNGSLSIYPSKDIIKGTHNCYTSEGSLLGKEIIMSGDSILFRNINDSSIIIKPNYTNDIYWQAYKDSNIIVQARIEGTLSDAVNKTISFKTFDKTMSPLGSFLDTCKIKLNKTNGIEKAVDFLHFPFEGITTISDFGFDKDNNFSLNNVKNNNLTWAQVYDFQAGDEIDINEVTSILNQSSLITTYNKTIKRYLERTTIADTIFYRVDREYLNNTSYIHDTIIEKITPNPYFDNLSYQAITIDYGGYLEAHVIEGNDTLKTIPSIIETVGGSDSKCLNEPIADGCFSRGIYKKGLGGPYYEKCEGTITLMSRSTSLVYYKKGSTEWGTPLTLDSKEEINSNASIIYPNPVKSELNIKAEATRFLLYNLTGDLVLNKDLNCFEETISLDGLIPGTYLYKLINKDNSFNSGKLIKE